MKRTLIALLGWLIFCVPAGAVDRELVSLSDGIAHESNRLKNATYRKSYAGETNDDEIIASLRRLRLLIRAYEKQIGLPAPPRVPVPIIDNTQIGTSSGIKDGYSVLYTDAETRKHRYRTIKIEHVSGDSYIRLREIKIVSARRGTLLFNAGGGKFYLGNTYEIELPEPLHISEISVRVQHRTGGLKISGDLAPIPVALPTVIELGISNGVKDGNANLNTQLPHRLLRIRKLRFQHTGGDEYIRLHDLRITTVNGTVITIEPPKRKLYPSGVFEIELPRPLQIKNINLRVQHRTSGLRITGIR
jgi:hypothetical protein